MQRLRKFSSLIFRFFDIFVRLLLFFSILSRSLSPAAQRTAPVLETLTPEKKDKKYSEGGAVTVGAGIAAVVALTTPLAIQEQQPLKEFQMKRQKVSLS